MNEGHTSLLLRRRQFLLLGWRSLFVFPRLLPFVDFSLFDVLDTFTSLFGHYRVDAVSLRNGGFHSPWRSHSSIAIDAIAYESAKDRL
jgi:hypothetical protein